MILAFSWSCTIFIASATHKKPWTNLSQPQVVPDKVWSYPKCSLALTLPDSIWPRQSHTQFDIDYSKIVMRKTVIYASLYELRQQWFLLSNNKVCCMIYLYLKCTSSSISILFCFQFQFYFVFVKILTFFVISKSPMFILVKQNVKQHFQLMIIQAILLSCPLSKVLSSLKCLQLHYLIRILG